LPKHNGLLSFTDVVLAGGQINMVTRFFKSGNLQEYMSKHSYPFLTEFELKECAHQLLDALRTLHMAGFIHS